MALQVSPKETQKRNQTELRQIYRALGLNKNGHLKKTVSQKKIEKIFGKGFDFSKVCE